LRFAIRSRESRPAQRQTVQQGDQRRGEHRHERQVQRQILQRCHFASSQPPVQCGDQAHVSQRRQVVSFESLDRGSRLANSTFLTAKCGSFSHRAPLSRSLRSGLTLFIWLDRPPHRLPRGPRWPDPDLATSPELGSGIAGAGERLSKGKSRADPGYVSSVGDARCGGAPVRKTEGFPVRSQMAIGYG
jgi:hypothetical protein